MITIKDVQNMVHQKNKYYIKMTSVFIYTCHFLFPFQHKFKIYIKRKDEKLCGLIKIAQC